MSDDQWVAVDHDPYEGLPPSPNVEDRRDQWLRGLVGRIAPATLFTVDDWKRMATQPFAPFYGDGTYPNVPRSPLSGPAGYDDIYIPVEHDPFSK